MSQKLCCIVTGKCITVTEEYYQKKVSEFGNENDLIGSYICRQAKGLLKRGYKIKEVRDLLKIDTSKVKEFTDKEISNILKKDKSEEVNFDNINTKKSDADVVEYIENLKRI
jgi:hypothetical protein